MGGLSNFRDAFIHNTYLCTIKAESCHANLFLHDLHFFSDGYWRYLALGLTLLVQRVCIYFFQWRCTTLYDLFILRLSLMAQIDFWRISATFFSVAAFCTTKIWISLGQLSWTLSTLVLFDFVLWNLFPLPEPFVHLDLFPEMFLMTKPPIEAVIVSQKNQMLTLPRGRGNVWQMFPH